MPRRLSKAIRIPLLVVAVYAAILVWQGIAHKQNSYFRAEAIKKAEAFYSRLENSQDAVFYILAKIGWRHRERMLKNKDARLPVDYVVLETHEIGGHHLEVTRFSGYFFVIFSFEEYETVILPIGETESQKNAAIESVRATWLYELQRGKEKNQSTKDVSRVVR